MQIAKIEIHTFPKRYQEPGSSEYVAQLQVNSFETNGEHRFTGKTENIALKKLFKEIGNIVIDCKKFHEEIEKIETANQKNNL